MDKKLVIFGAGEFATLVRFYFDHDGGRSVTAFVVDDEFVRESSVEGLPVVPFSEAPQRFLPTEYETHVAIAYGGLNRIRQRKFEACRAAGYTMASYVSSKAAVWADLTHGENCLILEHTTVQPTARIGSNVVVESGNHVGHGTVIRDHVYVSSHVCLPGNCEVGERCFIGVGVIARDHCKIGADSFVTMGAAVAKDLPPRSVVLGATSVVAKPAAADFIRRQFFPEVSFETEGG